MNTKTCWTDLLLDTGPIKAIFGSNCPTLEGVDLHEIDLLRDGPKVLLRFDLRDFPLDPPAKWASAGFNRVQIRLLAFEVRQLQIIGLNSEMKADINARRDGKLIHLSAESGIFRFDLRAEFLIVEGISAYRESCPRD